jgi:hypothetical protein
LIFLTDKYRQPSGFFTSKSLKYTFSASPRFPVFLPASEKKFEEYLPRNKRKTTKVGPLKKFAHHGRLKAQIVFPKRMVILTVFDYIMRCCSEGNHEPSSMPPTLPSLRGAFSVIGGFQMRRPFQRPHPPDRL